MNDRKKRRRVRETISRKTGLSELSEPVRPVRSTLVESESNSATPSRSEFGEALAIE